MRRAAVPLALLSAFSASSTHAQGAATLPGTVITATRVATRADEVLSDVTVIDRAAIEASTARTLPELLARVAGVQMASNGARGKASAVFIRGAENRHTIVLIDGVRVGSATLGNPTWEAIPIETIERIEVLKGPASALYGSDGVGGVVQIFTKKGRAGFHPNAALTAGSERHWEASAGANGGSGALGYAFGVQRIGEKGITATLPHVPFGQFNPDLDPFRQDTVSGSLDYAIATGWSADASLLYTDGITHFDDGPGIDSRSTIRTFAGHAAVKGQVLPAWATHLTLARSEDTSNAIQSAFPGSFVTTQTQWTWQNDVTTRAGTVVAGLDHRVQKVDSTTAYTVNERTLQGVFAGLNGSAGRHSWQLNVRHDRNSQFGNADTWFAGYGLRIADHWRVQASHGTSFVAPSFNQLYFPGFGNPNLLPERGRNTDLGVAWTQGAHELKLVRFDNHIRGFIPSAQPLPQNIPRVRIDGWTLGYDAHFERLNVSANAQSLNPRNEASGALLPRRAKQQLTLAADYRWGDVTVGGSLLHVGSRFDDAANRTPLGAYTTADAFVRWQFARDFSVQAKLNNIADKHYETAYGYNQPGREFFVTLRWQPK